MAQDNLEGAFDSIEVLSKARIQADSRVRLIKTMREDGDITQSENRHMVLLYDEARADVNSGIDRLVAELEARGKVSGEEPFEEVAGRAAKRVENFLAESDLLVFGEARSGMLEAGLSLSEAVIGAFVDVWKNLRGERTARHGKLVERLNGLKWQAFEEI